jgi:hypothetical protein
VPLSGAVPSDISKGILMIRRFLLPAALAAVLLPSAVHAASPMEAATLRLERGMTEQMAISAVGIAPTSTMMQTCGQTSGTGPWNCKTVIYGDMRSGGLATYFQQTRRGWLLAGWGLF